MGGGRGLCVGAAHADGSFHRLLTRLKHSSVSAPALRNAPMLSALLRNYFSRLWPARHVGTTLALAASQGLFEECCGSGAVPSNLGQRRMHGLEWRAWGSAWKALPPGCASGWQEGLDILQSKVRGARPCAGPEALHSTCFSSQAG